jgi:arsenite methyltransferase
MTRIIEFDGKEAAETERSYLTPDIATTRAHAIELLSPAEGDRVLDVGSGPGLLLQDIAATVGKEGHAAGIDISESMVAIAQERCRYRPNVEVVQGDATALPWPDAHFDHAVSMQVYEYVPDLAAAFAELYRVVKPGGCAVLMATDAETIIFGGANPETTARIRRAWPPHCAHPYLPRSLGGLLEKAGFEIIGRATHVILNNDFDVDHFGLYMARAMAVYAGRQGAVDKAEGKAWVSALEEAAARGDYFFSMNRYLFTAQR